MNTPLSTGQVLDHRYRISRLLGKGGMAAVFLAEDPAGKEVAIKLLPSDRSQDRESKARFAREARHAFRCQHPNIVKVIDSGCDPDGLLYLVMEYLDGRTAEQELAYDGAADWRRLCHILVQACDALSHAHGLGIIHRDLKPANLMLLHRDGDPDHVKVLDFGLSKVVDESRSPGGTSISLSSLTGKGIIFGTPEYMPPEIAKGLKPGIPADIYSLGISAYEMLCGERPFQATTPMDVVVKHVREAAAPLESRETVIAANVPGGLCALIRQCMSKSPDKRPQSAAELKQAILEVSGGTPRAAGKKKRSDAGAETINLCEGPGVEDSTTSRVGIALRGALIAALAVAAGVASYASVRSYRSVNSSDPAPGTLLAESRSEGKSEGKNDEKGDLNSDAKRLGILPIKAVVTPPPEIETGRKGQPKKARIHSSKKKHRSRASDPAVEKQLKIARQAKAAGNTLRQLSAADRAHRLAPRNREARYLMADALVSSGDSPRACSLLKGMRMPKVRTLAHKAGCNSL